MKLLPLILFSLIFCLQSALCAEFGEYRYSKYIALNQQIQNQRAIALRRQMQYNRVPTRGIRYPSANNPYPNISANQRPISANQRYSSNYYRRYY